MAKRISISDSSYDKLLKLALFRSLESGRQVSVGEVVDSLVAELEVDKGAAQRAAEKLEGPGAGDIRGLLESM